MKNCSDRDKEFAEAFSTMKSDVYGHVVINKYFSQEEIAEIKAYGISNALEDWQPILHFITKEVTNRSQCIISQYWTGVQEDQLSASSTICSIYIHDNFLYYSHWN